MPIFWRHGSDWGYTEVNLIGGEQQIADLQQQDLLYTVAEMSADAWTARIVGVVKRRCMPRSMVWKRAGKNVRASGRYCVTDHYRKRLLPLAGQRELQLDHPLIAADLQNPHQPKSAPGVVVEALARRKAAGLPAFSVMSCDNMPENGHVMRNVVCAYARAVDARLASGLRAVSLSRLPWWTASYRR
jgi:fructuronate reductase